MKLKFFAALVVYAIVVAFIEVKAGGLSQPLSSIYVLFAAHMAAIIISWLAYYAILGKKNRPKFPRNFSTWLTLTVRVIVGFVAVAAACYASIWLQFAPGTTSQKVIFVVTQVIIPTAFWGIISFTNRVSNKRDATIANADVRTAMRGEQTTIWVIANVVMVAGVVYAVNMNAHDPTGWSFLFTFPIYLGAAALMVVDAIVFLRLAAKLPLDAHRRRIVYAIASLFSVMPIILVFSYAVASSLLSQAAKDRADTPISLSSAQELVTGCKVDTLYRNYGGGAQMKLREKTPTPPGGKSQDEMRMLNLGDFDQILATARSKEVQDRCGYMPTYDIQRARYKPVNKWITVDEAKAIICTRSWLVHLYAQGYSPDPVLPSTQPTGILLSKQASVWNDDEESNIILINATQEARDTLQETFSHTLEKCHSQ